MIRNLILKNIVLGTIIKVLRLLQASEKRKALLVLFLTFIGSAIDVIGLASLLPVMYMALNTTIIHSNKYLNFIYVLLEFTNENSFLLFAVFLVLIIFILKNIVIVFVVYLQTRFCYSVATNLSSRILRSIIYKEFLSFKNINSSVIYRDVDMVPGGFSSGVMMSLINFISEFFILLLIVIALVLYSAKVFFLLIFILTPACIFIYYLLKNRSKKLGEEIAIFQVVSNKSIMLTIYGYVDMVLGNLENIFLRRYVSNKRKMNVNHSLQFVIDILPVKLIELTAIIGVVIIFSYVILGSANKTELITFLSLFVAAGYRIMPSISRMLYSLIRIKSSEHTFELLKPVTEYEKVSFINNNIKSTNSVNFNNFIEFNNISFTYPNFKNFHLKDISLQVKKGEIVGFIGKSGSGKTTLMKILLRFLKETGGNISVDGNVLNDNNVVSWRKLLGYVQQDVYIMDCSIEENVAFGVEEKNINLEKVNKAIELASLSVLVKSLPNGLKTIIGEHGSKLSGGQKQRIGIARALYKNAQILIFDEATNQLDTETENEITEAIHHLSHKNITIFIIAHRISTLQNCNFIYQLQDGKISGVHSYHELIYK